MNEEIKRKYQNKFQNELFKEVDNLFPEEESKERGKALLLITILGMKFGNLIDQLIKEIKQDDRIGKN